MHRSWPPSSFLRDLKAHIAPSRLWQIYWCRYHEWLRIIGGMISRRCASLFAAGLVISEEFEGPEPMYLVMADLLVQLLALSSSVEPSYWGKNFRHWLSTPC